MENRNHCWQQSIKNIGQTRVTKSLVLLINLLLADRKVLLKPYDFLYRAVVVHLNKPSMKRENEVYSLSGSYSPFIYKSKTGLTYCFLVTSGHVDMEFEFDISEQDLDVLKSSNYRFKALYYILFNEAQSTFGTGHTNPRRYTAEEFEHTKNKVLYKSEGELKLFIKQFSKEKNLAKEYFQLFSKNVFHQE